MGSEQPRFLDQPSSGLLGPIKLTMFSFSQRFIFLIQVTTHVHGFTFFARLPTSILGLYQATLSGRRGTRALGSRAGLQNFIIYEKNPKHATE